MEIVQLGVDTIDHLVNFIVWYDFVFEGSTYCVLVAIDEEDSEMGPVLAWRGPDGIEGIEDDEEFERVVAFHDAFVTTPAEDVVE